MYGATGMNKSFVCCGSQRNFQNKRWFWSRRWKRNSTTLTRGDGVDVKNFASGGASLVDWVFSRRQKC
jgi:hypothetical protein